MAKNDIVAPPGIRRSIFIPELNGLRGLAILAVLLFHFGSMYTPPNATAGDKLLMSFFRCGWTGVDLFFVLSGFLITGILLDTRESPDYFRFFYARRVLRIFPLYYGALVLLFVVAPRIEGAWHLTGVTTFLSPTAQLWYWLHLSNWKSAFIPGAFLVTNFWTLSIEEQFYLVWPAALAVCHRRYHRVLCLLLIATALLLRNTSYLLHLQSVYDNLIYRLTPFRLDTLAFGALIALLTRTVGWNAISSRLMYLSGATGLLLIFLAVATSGKVGPLSMPMIRFGYTGVGLACSSMVIYASTRSGAVSAGSRFLRSTLLTSLGEYSYGIYVFHGIVRYYLGYYASHFNFSYWRSSYLIIMTAGICLSYGIAYCSFHAYEQHFLKLKKFFSYAPKPSPLASTMHV